MFLNLRDDTRRWTFIVGVAGAVALPAGALAALAAGPRDSALGCYVCVLMALFAGGAVWAITYASYSGSGGPHGFPLDENVLDATVVAPPATSDVGLTRSPLRLDLACGRDGAGAVCAFAGTTRADESNGRRVVALDYTAHEQMAAEQLADLARRAKERWPIEGLTLKHRLGRVTVGEASVLIVVACPHRAEAFEACRWLIDTLKTEVAVWKKDVYQDGGTAWVDGNREAFAHLDGDAATGG